MLFFENYKWRLEADFSEFCLLKSRKLVKTCHFLFVVVSILGKGLDLEWVIWKGPIWIYIHFKRG
jgi:hypothetical protein